MKTINVYINEELRKHPLWCEVSLNIFKGAKNITKESIKNMLMSFFDVDGRMKKFSDYLSDTYPKEYLAYQPNDDEFIDKTQNNKIAKQIAEFILNYIV